ncbi:MAG TPA: Stf0 family sulfotransferase [Solirubrobacteraceae bacterium]|jgi:LPS sulfotransferase NodH
MSAPAPERCYLVCATPRSGSTLLCETLEQTGVAGRPREYFEALKETGVPRRPREYFWGLRSPEVLRLLPPDAHLDSESERARTWSREDYGAHLDAVLREGTTPNGVFAAKMMWGYFPDFLELARGIPRFGGMGDGSLLNAAFPGVRYVFVSRNDKVRQAVSLWRALQTWVWRKGEEPPRDAPAPERRAVYSFDAIDHLLDQLRRHEDAWRGFFFRIGQRPLSVLYEDIAGDLPATVARVLEWLGVELPGQPAPSPGAMSRQADELSDSWVQNYLEDVSRR